MRRKDITLILKGIFFVSLICKSKRRGLILIARLRNEWEGSRNSGKASGTEGREIEQVLGPGGGQERW